MFLYRRIASYFVHIYGIDEERDMLSRRLRKGPPLINKRVSAAKHLATILGMLLSKDGVFKRCLFVMSVETSLLLSQVLTTFLDFSRTPPVS